MAIVTYSQIYWWSCPSPVGELLLISDVDGLRGLHFQQGRHPRRPEATWKKERHPFDEVIPQLEQYFAGNLREFQVTLSLHGTAFQLLVWHALQQIPYGVTANYEQIARQIGNPAACRAVGAANGQNPVSIIVPCHRIIGKNGQLVGYGGGLPIKIALLNLERQKVNPVG